MPIECVWAQWSQDSSVHRVGCIVLHSTVDAIKLLAWCMYYAECVFKRVTMLVACMVTVTLTAAGLRKVGGLHSS